MDKAFVPVGPRSLPGKPAVCTVGRTPLGIVHKEIDAFVDRTPVHSPPRKSKGDCRGLAHFCVFRALLFQAFGHQHSAFSIEDDIIKFGLFNFVFSTEKQNYDKEARAGFLE